MKKLFAWLTCICMCFMAVTVCAAPVKIGMICLHDENATYDLNFINGLYEAAEDLELSDDQVIIVRNIPEGNECYETALDLVDEGCTVIFADSFGHESYLIDAARDYPNIQFCHATGTRAHTEGLSNFHDAFAAIYEGRYLAGVAAGLKLNELRNDGKLKGAVPMIGYIGAFTYAEVISGYTSFYLGAKSVCPDVIMKVQFTGSWYDEKEEKAAAEALIAAGADLISQHADSMGAPTACENANIPNVSYNGSTVNSCPNTFIVASRINWAPYFKYICECVANNTPINTDWVGTINSGSVILTEINTNAASVNTEEVLNTITEELIYGTRHVYDIDTFTVNGEKLNSYIADVDDYNDYIPETEVIFDGYFHESEFRSAPYFDLTIDGIELMNTAF